VTPDSREFWLDRGEAYFEVAHAADHPFVVHAGPRTITVLGTKFSVRRDGNRVSVSVVEGRVRVDQAGAGQSAPSTTITGGGVALADGASTLVTANATERVQHALSWRQGMLTFDQSTLADAAAEFNRYNRRQIVITDPEAAGIRIGGTFQAANIDAFARLLREAYGLRVEVRDGQSRISG
jgi:transmembrane sensor